ADIALTGAGLALGVRRGARRKVAIASASVRSTVTAGAARATGAAALSSLAAGARGGGHGGAPACPLAAAAGGAGRAAVVHLIARQGAARGHDSDTPCNGPRSRGALDCAHGGSSGSIGTVQECPPAGGQRKEASAPRERARGGVTAE